MNHRIRLSEAAFAPLEVYVLDVAHLEGPDEDEAATCREIADAVVRLPNGGAVLHLPDADDEARLWRWYAVVAAGAESAHESGHHSWERSLIATASKMLAPLRERERMRRNSDEPDESPRENWPISKIDPPANERGNVSHRAWHEALKAAGWVSSNERPDLFAVGDTALVSLENGYESWATIMRFYKNGAVGIRRREGQWNAREVWKHVRENPAPRDDEHLCRVCGKHYTLTREGKLRAHQWRVLPKALGGQKSLCPGSGKEPARSLFDERENMRENKGNQRFIRRAPVATRTGQAKRERRFRYTYDADEATRTTLPARVGEKLRIPHKGTIGHYEVVERLAPDVVGVRHDETNHAMVISDVGLRKLARDVYRPAPDTTPTEDVRHRHEREDALPKSRYETLKAIEDASGIEDHDFSIADAAYHAWKTAGAKQPKAKIEGKPKKGAKKGAKKTRGPRVKRPPKPPPWEGGQLDAFEADLKRGKHFTSLLEAFEHATRGARTWRDIEPALAMLRDTPGFQEARFPDDVYERHAQHDIELADQGHTIDVEQYGVTLPPNPTAADVSEAVLFAMPAGELSEEDEARAARESEGEDEEGLGDLWA